MMWFIHSPIDDGSGFIGVRWARHLDLGHGINVQVLSITTCALTMGGGVIIAVTTRRLLRSDTATRSETERNTVYYNIKTSGGAIGQEEFRSTTSKSATVNCFSLVILLRTCNSFRVTKSALTINCINY